LGAADNQKNLTQRRKESRRAVVTNKFPLCASAPLRELSAAQTIPQNLSKSPGIGRDAFCQLKTKNGAR
jgi:hypothetical protein